MEHPDQTTAPQQFPQQPVSAATYSEQRGGASVSQQASAPLTPSSSSRTTLPLTLSAAEVSHTDTFTSAGVDKIDGLAHYNATSIDPMGWGNGAQSPRNPGHKRRYSRLLIYLLTALIALLILSILGSWLIGSKATTSNPVSTNNPQSGQTSIENVAAKFHTSVVEIASQTSQGSSLGSGVIIDKRGYIVTNNHVIANSTNTRVILFDDTRLAAQIVGTDPVDDLAVIKIDPPADIAVAQIGDSSNLEVGQSVLAIGNPLGITQTVTSGIVSALGRNVSEGGGNTIIGAIQTDAAINPGNSGGALVNMQSDLIGIPTLVPIDPEFKTPATGVGFAIPSNRIKFIVPQLIQSGRVTNSGRASLGVQVISVDANIAAQAQLAIDHGALIVSTTANGPASQGGLRRGDVIVQVNKQPIDDIIGLQDALINHRPGEVVTVAIYRDKQQLTDSVKLGELQIP